MTQTLWIDTDVALGGSRGDVDDGFALVAVFCAARQRRARLAGVSTVFGNTSAELAEGHARRLADLASLSVPVVRGAERAGERTAAAEHMAALPEGTELLALGPLTNVAAACRIDPSLPSRVSLRIVGGNLSSRGLLPPLWPFEFNLARDVEAARHVLSAGWRELTLYPLDVVGRLRVNGSALEQIRRLSPLGEWIECGSRRWLARARWRRFSSSFPAWDLGAALDGLGLLSGSRKEPRALARGLCTQLLTRKRFQCLVAFDPTGAWRNFLALLAGG